MLNPFDESYNVEPLDAKAEVLMEQAIAQMEHVAIALFGHEDLPSFAERRAACIRLCAQVFDRVGR